MKAPKWMVKAAAKGNDLWMWILGDRHPDSMACFDILTTKTAEQFNIDNPTPENILCQSYGFKVKGSFSDSVFCLTYPLVRKFDGDNDGMVSTASMRWADFKGVRTSTTHRGISHADVVDMRRMRFTKKSPSDDDEVSDIVPFYVEVVKGLKEKGY